MSYFKLVCSLCVLGGLFVIQGNSAEGRRAPTQAPGGGGFHGGGIKPVPGPSLYQTPRGVAVAMPESQAIGYHDRDSGLSLYKDPNNTAIGYRPAGSDTVIYAQDLNGNVSAYRRAWGTGTSTPITVPFGGTVSHSPGEGMTFTGSGGNSANAHLTPQGNFVHIQGSNGGEALRNPTTGMTAYDGANMNAVGFRIPGSSTVYYAQNANGTPSAYSYDWATGTSTPLSAPAGGSFGYSQGNGLTYTGAQGNTANAHLTPQGNFVHIQGPNGGEALRNPTTGMTLYGDANNRAIGYRPSGSSTVRYVQNLDGTVSPLSYDWGTQTSGSFFPNYSGGTGGTETEEAAYYR